MAFLGAKKVISIIIYFRLSFIVLKKLTYNMNLNSNNWRQVLVMIVVFLIPLSACKKNDGNDIECSEIDTFIWKGLNQYYLWVDQVPDLRDAKFKNENELCQFLNLYNGNHEEVFNNLLYNYGVIDKWSWIVDDYIELENYFQGVTTSMGFEYGLVKVTDSENVYGFIQYVVPNSPAASANLTRGELFTKIDGQILTMNNYRDLLYNRDAFEISFADNTLTPNGKVLSLTAVVINENPIHYSEVLDIGGTKVAYLVYNRFTSKYDHALNDIFGDFKDEGVQELILDLRYNGGGSVLTATYLASMIYQTDTEKLFLKNQYNDVIQEYLLDEYGSSFFEKKLLNQIEASNGLPTAPINTLNLNRIYVLSTNGTASASELIVNGLNPYMDVVIIGTNTHGKYVGSITLKDYNSEGYLNFNHSWAMQPIVFKATNSVGFSDYVNGFAPTVFMKEDYRNIRPFGDENEALLKAALDHIKGVSTPSLMKSTHVKTIMNSKDLQPFSKDMYMDLNL